ncbi:metallophosphoesterase 1 isoform X1 [Chelonoidis abingdonii]|uniref:metallophosphoesterase 1 isoform X1 n=2 Tax=Chelonoidis abingdonii TaxID=106734 RepID=UPI0013F25BAE|nr:metallophosphoesterase 1 isoform X1 [Chelonoidis abingdonii]XP_032645322.1 metallophosphoesterase 1 isoform X1 [Chelonoidis abingdonii]XP_032645332.1 metallophosphoesterase 1 isoform X1 [Chelonoidis abingdonii]XP_032645342.1 metallophosphoesterase 1 isoform X1 [Chelonoidis abingdonii]
MKEGALPLGNNFSMRSDLGTMKILHLKKRGCFLLKLLCLVVLMLIFCEFLVYYVVILQCHWPEVKIEALRSSRQSSASVLKAMFLSDTHLLGEIKGHWLDKLRREWQMERAFQTALSLLEPDIVFILGDVFDEGKWSSSQAWADDVRRFQKMFRHPVRTELMVVVGNHDIGFHYEMTPYKLKRFAKVFNFTSGKLIIRKGVNFVMVNSVALDGDGCTICSRAEAKLMKLSHKLNCSQQQEQNHSNKRCNGMEQLPASEPILLQHYPLYRRSDAECIGEDSALPEEKNIPFKEKYDVLSREASQKLLWWFHPRLILSGHTHSACEVLHNGKIPEISVPSFSWRNRNNPSFIMGSITPTDFSLYKCFLPLESRVVTIYCIAGALLGVLILAHLQLFNPPFYFAQHLIRKHKAV